MQPLRIILIKGNTIQAGQAGDVYHRFNAFADTAFEFEHQIGGSGDKPGFFTFF
jgi:hypothetical protein